MSNFDIDLSGIGGLREEINDLADDWGDNATYVVEAGAEYAVFP